MIVTEDRSLAREIRWPAVGGRRVDTHALGDPVRSGPPLAYRPAINGCDTGHPIHHRPPLTLCTYVGKIGSQVLLLFLAPVPHPNRSRPRPTEPMSTT